MGSSILGVVGAVTGTCLRADCVSEPQDRRGSAVRGDAEATVRSGGAGVLPMTLVGRPDIEMGRRWCVNALCSFSVLILLIYRERASPKYCTTPVVGVAEDG